MIEHEKINYLEFPALDIQVAKAFFSAVFAWTFEDYGEEYVAFAGAGIDGGFYQSDLVASSERGGVLVVFYSAELEATQAKITTAGGSIAKAIFSFPGGRRFHFFDPNGNEFAVWSDK